METSQRATLNALHLAEETEVHKRESLEYTLRKRQEELNRVREEKTNAEERTERYRTNSEEEAKRLTLEIIHLRDELSLTIQNNEKNAIHLEKEVREKDRAIHMLNEDQKDLKGVLDDVKSKHTMKLEDITRGKCIFIYLMLVSFFSFFFFFTDNSIFFSSNFI